MISFLATLLLLAFFNSLVIIGIYEAGKYEDKQQFRGCELVTVQFNKDILWFVSFYSLKWFGPFWSKPIIRCTLCMSSLHSLYIFWPAYYYSMPHDLIHALAYLIYIPLLGGITTVIVNVIYRD